MWHSRQPMPSTGSTVRRSSVRLNCCWGNGVSSSRRPLSCFSFSLSLNSSKKFAKVRTFPCDTSPRSGRSVRKIAGGNSARKTSGISKSRSNRCRLRAVWRLISSMVDLGSTIPPSSWLGWGRGMNPPGNRSRTLISSGDIAASWSKVTPAGRRTRTPAWIALPRDIVNDDGRSDRSYRCCSSAACRMSMIGRSISPRARRASKLKC